MADPISITLAALAFLDPAIKACRKSYGIYKLSKNFGKDHRAIQLRLSGQQACLELAFKTELTIKPDQNTLDAINEQLGNIINHNQSCQDMIANIEGHLSRLLSNGAAGFMGWSTDNVKGTPKEPPKNLETQDNNASVDHKSKDKSKQSKSKWYKPNSWKQKPSDSLPSDASSSLVAQSESTVTTSEDNLTTTPSSALSDRDAQVAAENQRSAFAHDQEVASIAVKAKWIRQRKAFIAHIEDIQSSINIITTIVGLRIQADNHTMIVAMAPVVDGPVPDNVLSAQDSLQRLHRALLNFNESGKSSSNHKLAIISIRAMKAIDYVQTRKKVQATHTYLHFRKDTAVHPLQVGFANEALSTMILAESAFTGSTSVAKPSLLKVNSSLPQLLCDKEEDAEHSLRAIGSILTPGSSTDFHELFQDISTSWTIRDTLEGLMKRTEKYRTFINLAVHIATSYILFLPIAQSHSYPQLSNYLYYSPNIYKGKDFKAEHILTPFLNVGFGSKAPKKGTLDLGGFESHITAGDEALVRLGVILHQIGCWKVFDDMELEAARKMAKSKRDDLLVGTGMPFTQVVELCLRSKEEEYDPLELAKRIHGQVVTPLQKLVDELNWD